MKIQTQLNKTADEISLAGNNLIINGDNYDLNNVQPLSENELPENQRIYLSGEDLIIFLKIDVDHQTMFISNKRKDPEGNEYICSNLMLLYDINNDKDISRDELEIIVDQWNSPESVRRTYNINRKKEALKTMTLGEYYLTGKVV